MMGLNGTDMRDTPYAVMFGSVVVLGLPLNAVSLWILLCRHSLQSASTVFMVNLAVSDLLLVLSLPLRVYFYATGTWPLDRFTCVTAMMLFRNNIRSSSILITFISVDRLLAVVYPLRSRHLRTSANAWKSVVFLWLFVLGLNVPESIKVLEYLKVKESVCFDFRYVNVGPASPTPYVHLSLVLAMLAVNVVCTCLVSWTLRRRLNDSARVNNKVNVMLIFVVNLIMFTLFFLPISLLVLFKNSFRFRTPLTCLASMNCCFDPLLYYFSLDGFWKKKEEV